jgi:hypothetical protein
MGSIVKLCLQNATKRLNVTHLSNSALDGDICAEREREKTVVVFITKQMIKLHLNDYIHRVAIVFLGKKRAKSP